jgi:hypothetical protein
MAVEVVSVGSRAGLERTLAASLLWGEFAEGDTIRVDADAERFTFEQT